MKVFELSIPAVKVLSPARFGDTRGFFQETWNDQRFREMVADETFVQDNHSKSARRGTLRGLHFQHAPHAQGKLFRVIKGSVVDVAVDVRKDSPTYGQHVSVTLDAVEGKQIWIPAGFLHGFCTLEDETEVAYKVTAYYSAKHDAGVIWNDPDLAIQWPFPASELVLSEKDQSLPRLEELAR